MPLVAWVRAEESGYFRTYQGRYAQRRLFQVNRIRSRSQSEEPVRPRLANQSRLSTQPQQTPVRTSSRFFKAVSF